MASDGERRKIATLASRLEAGYEKIEQAQQRGEDVKAWEEFWIDLLREYEEQYDAAYGTERKPS